MVDSNPCFNYCMHVSIMIYLQAGPDLKLVLLHFDYIALFSELYFDSITFTTNCTNPTPSLCWHWGVTFTTWSHWSPPPWCQQPGIWESRDQIMGIKPRPPPPLSLHHTLLRTLPKEGCGAEKVTRGEKQWIPHRNDCLHPIIVPPNCLHCPPAHCQTFKITKSPIIDLLTIAMSEILTLRQISLVIIWGDLKSLRFQWFHIFYWLWWSKRHHIPNGRQYFRR